MNIFSKLYHNILNINPLSPSYIYIVFWIGGVLFPYYITSDIDPFFLYWPYNFSDGFNTNINFAFIIYTISLLTFISANNLLTKKFTTSNTKSKYYFSKKRAYIFTFISIAAYISLIEIKGGFLSFLTLVSDRTRAFAGMNVFFMLGGLVQSVIIAYYLNITENDRVYKKNKYKFIMYLMLVISLIMLSGSKSTIFILLISLITIYNYKVSKISLFKLISYLVIIFILLIAYHLLKQEYFSAGELYSIGASNPIESFYLVLLNMFQGNMMQLQTMSIVVDQYPNTYGYLWGSSILFFFSLIIPSVLWSEKPLTIPGIFTVNNWPYRWSDEGTTLPPGLFAEGYMNFGLFGVIIFSLILSFVYSFYYKKVKTCPFDKLSLGIYSILVGEFLHFFRGEFASVLLHTLVLVIPLKLILKKKRYRE